ncbi:PDR/VanB family oxidoreductase [Rhodopseudomonas sp. BAL398]|uniref:PDR/VanB family oxidoreductase n=1 Tax=Rhodopseudomonas sp. BAL398 TaxID=3034676 RepID=UPI00294B60EB|nr:PDR/VanB family oxidoreductase [Rhodopseudomonas sp. BAL398]WOK16755.1 PDR/VanB family oxidoreductase [Rhodopseudomonas sp. BAL398]
MDLRLPDGRVRQYSLCGDPDDTSKYVIAIKREAAGRGGSNWAHDTLGAGSELHVSAPRNNFPLDPDGDDYVLIAGGIGITPLISMARMLQRRGKTFTLHDCARSAAEAPLLDELEDLCGPSLQCWFSRGGTRFDPAIVGPYQPGRQIYICGPQRLLDAAQARLSDWPEDHVHGEVFQMTVDENFKPEPFEATIRSTGQRLLVPADKSLLTVLRENGFIMPSSCELGICGSCECGYRDGIVLHRDKVLPTSKRQDRLMLCVSRARVGLTLDL